MISELHDGYWIRYLRQIVGALVGRAYLFGYMIIAFILFICGITSYLSKPSVVEYQMIGGLELHV